MTHCATIRERMLDTQFSNVILFGDLFSQMLPKELRLISLICKIHALLYQLVEACYSIIDFVLPYAFKNIIM